MREQARGQVEQIPDEEGMQDKASPLLQVSAATPRPSCHLSSSGTGGTAT